MSTPMQHLVETPLRPCQRTGCQHFATGTILLLVPFEGYGVPPKHRAATRKEMEPLQLFIGIDLCKAHGASARAVDFVNPDMERAVIRACIEHGKPKPAFERAIIGGRPLDDPKYLEYKAMMARANGPLQ
jgi:hypothetical protein